MSEQTWSGKRTATWKSKVGLAEMLMGGVIMDVVTPEQAKIAEEAGAAAVMALEIDFIDESEVLTPADDRYHILKDDFTVPFVCGCRNLGEALRRIGEGAALIRSKGKAGTGGYLRSGTPYENPQGGYRPHRRPSPISPPEVWPPPPTQP